jgi:RNA polymerase sigma-54 factor
MAGNKLRQFLNEQLTSNSADEALRDGIQKLITYVDENGYISQSLADISGATGHPLEDVERFLQGLQKLRPTGVGARTVRECLLLQSSAQFAPDHLIHALIDRHLSDLEKQEWSVISISTGVDESVIRETADLIKNLNPVPGRMDS